MDPRRFDSLSRELTRARSRRGALAAVLGSGLVLWGRSETEGKKKRHKKKKHRSPSSPPPVSPPGSPPPPVPPPPPVSPPPPPCVPACAGRDCGADGCGGQCGPCPAPATCSAQGQCLCDPPCTMGAVCQAGQCVNGTLAIGATCDQTLPRACGSGVCGCIGQTCTCRNPACSGVFDPCATDADCCTGYCYDTGIVGLLCF
jgi:hypothetical protein